MKTNFDSLRFSSIQPVQRPDVQRPSHAERVTPKDGGTFSGAFDRRLEQLIGSGQPQATVTFSKHAETRLQSREIPMTALDLVNLDRAVQKLQEKGARSSLVLTDAAALIVNVPERKVVTAMDRAQLKENVFTNIDSTIVI